MVTLNSFALGYAQPMAEHLQKVRSVSTGCLSVCVHMMWICKYRKKKKKKGSVTVKIVH